jgi:hypothetical protein
MGKSVEEVLDLPYFNPLIASPFQTPALKP